MTVDEALVEDGTEGGWKDAEWHADLPTREDDRTVPDAEILQAIRIGAEDAIRWPRHFVGPATSARFVAARRSLYERGLISFNGRVWYLTSAGSETLDRCGLLL